MVIFLNVEGTGVTGLLGIYSIWLLIGMPGGRHSPEQAEMRVKRGGHKTVNAISSFEVHSCNIKSFNFNFNFSRHSTGCTKALKTGMSGCGLLIQTNLPYSYRLPLLPIPSASFHRMKLIYENLVINV